LGINDSFVMWLLIAFITRTLRIDMSKIAEEYACHKNDFIFMWSLNNSMAHNIKRKVNGIDEYDHYKNYDQSFLTSSSKCRYTLCLYFDVYHINEQKHWTEADKKMLIDLLWDHFWKKTRNSNFLLHAISAHVPLW
jgi:hypothetical protein